MSTFTKSTIMLTAALAFSNAADAGGIRHRVDSKEECDQRATAYALIRGKEKSVRCKIRSTGEKITSTCTPDGACR